MIRTLTYLILFLLPSALFAEEFDADKKIFPLEKFSVQYNVVDTADLEIVYAHAMFDPVLKQKELRHEMLAIGNNYQSMFIGYGYFQVDSVADAHSGEFESFNEERERFKKYDTSGDSELILKNFKTDVSCFHGIIFGQSYQYEEPIPEINWELTDGTKEILGYECHKATARWRGRDWTAWYSDIPFSDGPWKFTGLPGLILGLEDATGEHRFQAIGIKKDNYPFGFRRKSKPIKTKREKFEAMQKDHKLNAGKTLANSGLVQVKPEDIERISRRLFYCPIELE